VRCLTENIADFTQGALVGAECGYNEGLKHIGKGITCQIMEKAAQKLHYHEISDRFRFSFILGLPWETKKEVEKTIRFAAHLLGEYGVSLVLQWYCQIPGSHLWQKFRNDQLVNETMYDHYGFFRDLYLFRSGVHLTPQEIWEIDDTLSKLIWISEMRYPKKKMLLSQIPLPIAIQFPREIFNEDDAGLNSLRQLSHSASAIK